MPNKPPGHAAAVTVTRDDFDDLAARASAGSQEALDDLRRVLRYNPAIYQLLGDLGRHAQRALIDLVGGASVIARETVRLNVEELRRDLLRDGDSPLERLLAEQIVASWLDVNIQQMGQAQPHDQEAHRKRWEQRLSRAQARHFAAIKALAEVRERHSRH